MESDGLQSTRKLFFLLLFFPGPSGIKDLSLGHGPNTADCLEPRSKPGGTQPLALEQQS